MIGKLILTGLVAILFIPVTNAAHGDVYIQDEFTVGGDTNLEDHTPTTAGTGYTELISEGGGSLYVESTTDSVQVDAGGGSDGALYTAQGTYSSHEYKACLDILDNIESGDNRYVIAVRVQDVDNFYYVSYSDDEINMYEVNGGVHTEQVILENQDPMFVDGEQTCVRITGTTNTFIEFIVEDITMASWTDSTDPHTAAGEAAMGAGAIGDDGDDMGAQNMDNFIVTEFSATCETRSVTAAADDATVGTITWSNPSNVTASNNTYATAATAGGGFAEEVSHYIKATSLGFAIDADAIIGIEVTAERKCSDDAGAEWCSDNSVVLVKAGVIQATDRASASHWGTADASASNGSIEDLWGDTWSEADIENAGFGVAFAATMKEFVSVVTASVDHIQIKVCYTPGAPAPPSGAPKKKNRGHIFIL